MNSTLIKVNPSRSKHNTQNHSEEEGEVKNIMNKSRRGSTDQHRNISDMMTKSIDMIKEIPIVQ